MARPPVRTARLLLDDAQQIRNLFGTVKNAFALLRLEGRVPYSSFYRALAWDPVRPEEAEIIEDAWVCWKETFLGSPDTPASFQVPL